MQSKDLLFAFDLNRSVVKLVHSTIDTKTNLPFVLTVAMVIQQIENGRYRVQGAMRLVAKDGSIVWADTIYSSPFAHSASSSFAGNTAKKLTTFLAQGK